MGSDRHLFKDLAPDVKLFNAFGDQHFEWAALDKGSSFWIPYDYSYASITRVGGSVNSRAIMQPIVSATMASRLSQPLKDNLRWSHLGLLVARRKAKEEPWRGEVGEKLQTWVEAGFPLQEGSAGTAANGLALLTDGVSIPAIMDRLGPDSDSQAGRFAAASATAIGVRDGLEDELLAAIDPTQETRHPVDADWLASFGDVHAANRPLAAYLPVEMSMVRRVARSFGHFLHCHATLPTPPFAHSSGHFISDVSRSTGTYFLQSKQKWLHIKFQSEGMILDM